MISLKAIESAGDHRPRHQPSELLSEARRLFVPAPAIAGGAQRRGPRSMLNPAGTKPAKKLLFAPAPLRSADHHWTEPRDLGAEKPQKIYFLVPARRGLLPGLSAKARNRRKAYFLYPDQLSAAFGLGPRRMPRNRPETGFGCAEPRGR